MKTLSDIRSTFLTYFEKNGHEIVTSSPLVPQNDPTLMFTNAGMVQFKDVFTGMEQRSYTKAATSQKCVRAGGKHNDLDNVGYTARHHTFFEMLGNFSFGDYFKDDAIRFAWELITKDFGINPEKLCVTIYHDDDEAFKIWKKITGFHDSKIIRIPTADNFWSMGDTGPCGPCSEIFYDHGDSIFGGPPGSKDQDGDRFIEIWNLVFMQFEQHADGSRTNLPKPSIDTGMGLERISALLQGQHNNYDTDLFQDIIAATKDIVGGDGKRQSYNVIADHLRACSFLVADGVMPSNEGRGYVLRRIMRRAMRHAHMLGAKDPLMHKLVPTLVSLMGATYPELHRAQAFISQTFKTEEEKFRQTLSKGLKLLDDALVDHKNVSNTFSGDVAFKLYDTYGFPLDLTQDILRDKNLTVDTDAFNSAMQHQKDMARAAWVGSGAKANEHIYFDVKEKVGASEFLGYTTTTAEGVVLAIINNGELVGGAYENDEVSIIVNQSPFYGESGGQVGDQGTIECGGGKFTVTSTYKKLDNLIVHNGRITNGALKINDAVKLTVDINRRLKIAANHSATHLLHKALRDLLGDHVTQKGSLVDDNRLRFDFAHHQAVSPDELLKIETIVNQQISLNTLAETKLMTPDEAIAAGAMALFGERYGDEVRVVSLGDSFSTELCGGTHVQNTGDIGLFKIISEGSVASGIRRIEAITNQAIITHIYDLENALADAKDTAKTQILELNKQVQDLSLRLTIAESKNAEQHVTIKDVPFIVKHLKNVPAKELRALADEAKGRLKSGVIVVSTVENDKISFVIGVTQDLTSRINAVDLVKASTEFLGGKGGGGRPDMAQSGGVFIDKIPHLITMIEGII
jgi:alanyl-tRNA synthetase